MGSERLSRLPDSIRRDLVNARKDRGWSQAELGRRTGLPQAHISGIETGKLAPRYTTLLDLVRVLGHDLMLIPRSLVPAVQAMVRGHGHPDTGDTSDGEPPLYSAEVDEDGDES